MMDIQEIPDWWALCPGYGCEKAEDCLRNMAFRDVRKGTTRWMCVLPEAMKDGECSYVQSKEKVRMACGFHELCRRIHGRDARHLIRMELTERFGSKGSYYRYKDGDRLLTPELQEMVSQVFRRHGFKGEIVFDKYFESYNYTMVP